MSETTRRTVLAGAAGASALAALSACTEKEAEEKVGATASDVASRAADAGGAVLAAVADIPVGGGKIFADQRVVVTQPSAGEFKAFSATCTHRQCVVSEVRNGTINCACHNSSFKISDGSVVTGPATRPLPAATVKVENDKIVVG